MEILRPELAAFNKKNVFLILSSFASSDFIDEAVLLDPTVILIL